VYEIFRYPSPLAPHPLLTDLASSSGIDRSEVKEKAALNKSMMAAKNLPKPITKASDGPSWLRVLAAELVLRLNEIREEMPLVWPKTIALGARNGAPFPPSSLRRMLR
jgi:hypothetical protein